MKEEKVIPENQKFLLEVQGLSKNYQLRRHLSRRVIATIKSVNNVSFGIARGQTVGLVGESGCGKTTLARCILRAIEPTQGYIGFHDGTQQVDVLGLDRTALRKFRRHMQLIFQDPYSSLNPRMTIRQIIGEPLLLHKFAKGRDLEDRVRELVRQVGLDPNYLNRYPHAFSGGQRQRIGIARALALNPALVIADEAVSALDMSMQAQILNLLKDLQLRLHLTYLFIAHDLSVIRHFCGRIMVMYAGKFVEEAIAEDIFSNPGHPYTEALLSAAPNPDTGAKTRRIILSGEVPDPANLPAGCPFHPRCRYAQLICRAEIPTHQTLGDQHAAACHFAGQLKLAGISS